MDFFQERITTIHDYCINKEQMEDRLYTLRSKRPATLIIPILYEAMENNTLQNIIKELNLCKGIKQVVIALAAKDEQEYKQVLYFFNQLKIPHIIVWCNGIRVSDILLELKEKHLDVTQFSGKGKDIWIAMGIASLNSYAIAFHDADIVNYSKSIPIKLLYPIVEPKLDFYFNKGYYARIDLVHKKMHGRVYRLFVRPLIETLQKDMIRKSDILEYFQAFRYTLTGEFAMTKSLALSIRIPSDWGLEIGLLSEIYNNTILKRICQIDLGFYDHKHKDMSDKTRQGLNRMAQDVFRTFLRVLSETTNTHISLPYINGIRLKYKRFSQDLIRQYYTDAFCNNLEYSRHMEEMYVDMFSEVIIQVGEKYLQNPLGVLLPNWARALSAIPDLREKIYNAAVLDAKFYSKQ